MDFDEDHHHEVTTVLEASKSFPVAGSTVSAKSGDISPCVQIL